ncbi:MAG: 30S ribosomal protein S21, partial [Anaerolineaceae bacterium]|nr:30S ribosomal protein S21 [Anaerolineaceae bacterium]
VGLFSFLINVIIVLVAIKIIPGFIINNGQTVILVVLGITLINLLVSEILALDENDSYHRLVISRFGKNNLNKNEPNSPGMLIIQIDGLSKTIFESAINKGIMPSLAFLYHQNMYRLEEWFSGLPSQTSSCQMGIIYGKNNDIPAFRWYEKENQKLIVSNHLNDTALIESRYGFDDSLLIGNASSIGNMFSGGAEKSAMTMSQLPTGRQIATRSGLFYNFFLNPYNYLRTFFLLFLEIIREYYQKIFQVIKNRKPRISRSFIFAVERALAAVLLRELTTHIIIEDMFNGYQTIYATYVGYDVVAHKTGIDSSSTHSVLRTLDKQFERIINANKLTKRNYSIIFLSDHGQSQGSTFRQVYGLQLEDLIRQFISDNYSIMDAGASEEIKGYVNSLLQEALTPHRKVNQSARKIYRQLSTRKGTFTYFDLPPRITIKSTDLIICPSGNMALVYFSFNQERMSFEQISDMFPDLIANIVSHPGIGFVMVASEEHGTMLIHSNGINFLTKDQFEGSDILMISPIEVEVNGDLERAFKNLKKKMAFEGVFKELKRRRYY